MKQVDREDRFIRWGFIVGIVLAAGVGYVIGGWVGAIVGVFIGGMVGGHIGHMAFAELPENSSITRMVLTPFIVFGKVIARLIMRILHSPN